MKKYRPEIGHENGKTFACLVPDDESGFAYTSSEVDAHVAKLESRIKDLENQLALHQAEIDSLMLEYCPDEMSAEQRKRWATHQRPA